MTKASEANMAGSAVYDEKAMQHAAIQVFSDSGMSRFRVGFGGHKMPSCLLINSIKCISGKHQNIKNTTK